MIKFWPKSDNSARSSVDKSGEHIEISFLGKQSVVNNHATLRLRDRAQVWRSGSVEIIFARESRWWRARVGSDRTLGANGKIGQMLKRALLVRTHDWGSDGAALVKAGVLELAFLGLGSSPFEEDADLGIPARGGEDVAKLGRIGASLFAIVEDLLDLSERFPAVGGVLRKDRGLQEGHRGQRQTVKIEGRRDARLCTGLVQFVDNLLGTIDDLVRTVDKDVSLNQQPNSPVELILQAVDERLRF